MSNFLIILGLVLFFFCFLGFFISLAIVLPKAEKEGSWWAGFPFLIMGLMFVIGMVAYSIGMGIKEDQPMEVSTKCGKVLGYKHYSGCSGRSQTRCYPYERIQIRLDGSEYSRLMRFDGHLQRQNKGDHVCFEFYDRFKYSHLKDSRIINWSES